MAVPKTVTWERDPHTQAKHQILKEYLQAYFPIMANRFADVGVCFVDAFAGPGEYTDGALGSPVLALRAARHPQVYRSRAAMDFVYIEKDPNRSAHLKELLSNEEIPSQFHITPETGACEDVLLPTLDRLGVWSRPIFVNFDGWGVDTPFALVARIGESKRPEVLVTFHSQWLTRFADKEDTSAGDEVSVTKHGERSRSFRHLKRKNDSWSTSTESGSPSVGSHTN